MICILLAAGHNSSNLDNQIKDDQTGNLKHLEGVPKAMLPSVGGKKILDYWWDLIKSRQLFSEVYLVTNADKYKHFERWATASEFPTENIVNDGTTSLEGSLGAVADLELCLRTKGIKDNDILVLAADMMCHDQSFDIAQLIKFFKSRKEGDLAIYYELFESECSSTRALVEVCPKTNRITKFFEKPQGDETDSRYASVVFYCLRKTTLQLIPRYLEEYKSYDERSLGFLLAWLINTHHVNFYGMKLPTGFQLIGKTSLNEYQNWLAYFTQHSSSNRNKQRITKRAYARVGLMGNPSDGFFGKTISLSIKNFWAEVSLTKSDRLVLQPHPLNDPTEFGSLADLYWISAKEGYLGGLRLLQATCKQFYNYFSDKGVALAKKNFTLKYDTNVPRQVGLAGSSAIVTATLKCLMDFFDLTEDDMPKEFMPEFILGVEVDELNINAGLQDRVVQVYEGLVYMDFSREVMAAKGHGNYQRLDIKDLPPFFLAYLDNPSDSGRIHSNVRGRWDAGESDVVVGMNDLAALTDDALVCIRKGDWSGLASLMKQNFNKRLEMYGASALGEQNLDMIRIASKYGAGAKFPGSGGAILGLLEDQARYDEMVQEFQNNGYVVTKVLPNL